MISNFIQYVIVTDDGGVYDCSLGQNLAAAKAVAAEATRTNTEGLVLQVARLVALTSEEAAGVVA